MDFSRCVGVGAPLQRACSVRDTLKRKDLDWLPERYTKEIRAIPEGETRAKVIVFQ
jgi:hypothetical protein